MSDHEFDAMMKGVKSFIDIMGTNTKNVQVDTYSLIQFDNQAYQSITDKQITEGFLTPARRSRGGTSFIHAF